MLGSSPATDSTGVLVSTAGTRVAVEISSVPLMNGERVVGVFGLIEGHPDDRPTAPHPHLTPRQVEVLRLLEQGRSTKQIYWPERTWAIVDSNHGPPPYQSGALTD